MKGKEEERIRDEDRFVVSRMDGHRYKTEREDGWRRKRGRAHEMERTQTEEKSAWEGSTLVNFITAD